MYLNLNGNMMPINVAKSFHQKLMGFMFKKNFNYGILFPKTNSIHTFFMKENIDVIALDEKNQIIEKVVNMPKNKTLYINYPMKKTSILELPANTSFPISIGDTLTFISK